MYLDHFYSNVTDCVLTVPLNYSHIGQFLPSKCASDTQPLETSTLRNSQRWLYIKINFPPWIGFRQGMFAITWMEEKGFASPQVFPYRDCSGTHELSVFALFNMHFYELLI